MPGGLRHLGRFFEIGRILARHDALFMLREAPLPPMLKAGMAVFQGLFGRRLPDLRPGERLANAMAELGPSFIKLGQILSVRPDLVGPELAEDLGRLRDKLPPFAWSEAKASIETELGGRLDDLFVGFEPEPVAAASVAQVHFAEAADGSKLAVKVLRPGVEAAFARDLALFAWLADLSEDCLPGMHRLRPRAVVQAIAAQVAIEMDLRLEAAAASEIADNFRDDADLLVPRPDWNRTARRVLTLQRIAGIPIEDRAALLAAGHDLPRLAERVIQVFLRQALRDGYFHADMHHGNLFVGENGRLELVDFGIMGRIDMPTRRFMAEMLGAFLAGDWRRAAEVHIEAGYVPLDPANGRTVEAFAQACRSIGEPILGKPVTEISIGRLLAQLFQITETFGMRTQPHLLLLQKTMVTVEGVARSLDETVNFWEASRPVVLAWAAEHMGPEAQIRDAILNSMASLRRLPKLLDRLEAADEPRPVIEQAPDRKLHWLLGLIAVLLAANLLLD
ncbi:2-polyprenylphenol 6-hydroxylase [Ferrovibrio sp.]|uniref:2-polyprenylphenol 6-hydroxylase n=1 Tax=Ferrovibrio sp. TaxID=1917215 RepID=UPI001B4064D7|nr:2-polyprenylphenol 6-hydroxylase [Ferrovibrio sp.]MBP7062536.1 2-polyprenylphenol 6-hydroxylase [Ferrovibrio sp.]